MRANMRERRAFVLVAVVMVVVLLSLAAYQFSGLMESEADANRDALRTVRTRCWAESGIHYAAGVLLDPSMQQVYGSPLDNPDLFRFVPVDPESVGDPGFFTVVALTDPLDISAGGFPYRYGLSDEAGKLNVNTFLKFDETGELARQVMLRLPDMTEDVADAILDWLDADDEPREFGAEYDAYPTYFPKNGPLHSLDELLMVRGVTPWLLHGGDRTRNGMVDPGEQPGLSPRGLAPYLTVHSREANVASDGSPRIHINNSDLLTLRDELSFILPPEVADWIIAYRVHGPASRPSGRAGSPDDLIALVDSAVQQQGQRLRNIGSIYDLIDKTIQVNSGSGRSSSSATYPSPLQSRDMDGMRLLLPILLDYLTTSEEAELPARVNINSAPQAIIEALPELEPEEVGLILALRPPGGQTSDPLYATPAWLITEAGFSVEGVKLVEKLITTRSSVYSAQVIGHGALPGGPATRMEFVIDVSQGVPRIAYVRDLTELGTGFDIWGN